RTQSTGSVPEKMPGKPTELAGAQRGRSERASVDLGRKPASDRPGDSRPNQGSCSFPGGHPSSRAPGRNILILEDDATVGQRAPIPTLRSFVILAFSSKVT
uniref:Uncharacterized protein n=1 Tax=Phocoena sinus TaxID=42100 RepID=A0A8C9CGL2_PHOSS